MKTHYGCIRDDVSSLGMKIMNNDFQLYLHNFWVFVTVIPPISNDITLALTQSIEFT